MKLKDYTIKTVDGKEFPLKEYNDKVLLIVNTASEWGLNSQLGELQELNEKYYDKGLRIFGFPCNQFAELEPLNGIDILNNYKEKFNVQFPISVKIEVNGENIDPLYKLLKVMGPYQGYGSLKEKAVYYSLLVESNPEYLEGNELRWNYTKYLISKGGDAVERYEPSISPKKISHRIEEFLGI